VGAGVAGVAARGEQLSAVAAKAEALELQALLDELSAAVGAARGLLADEGTKALPKRLGEALAELEAAMQTGSLVDFVQRFESGAFSSRDVLAILQAGLRGGGIETAPDLAQAEITGGPMRAAQVAAQLLVRAFAVPTDGSP